MQQDKPPPEQPAANDEAGTLAALRGLLLGPEQQSIRRLDAEIHDPRAQTERVADLLPESLDRAYRSAPADLSRALDRPVIECLKGSVQRDPGLFADVLYPVMGPAIRRSITQALRGLIQEINQTLEHSLTIKGLRWRLESARSGVPFAEIVLRNTLRYRVEELFLIQSGSGLLIRHLTQTDGHSHDPDAVSGMLTAIRDFAGDTLDGDTAGDTRLETIDTGEHTLWLVHGPRAYLACAIRGVPPAGLRDDLANVVEDIHRIHGDVLTGFADEPELADRLNPLLEPCLQTEMTAAGRQRAPWLAVILGLLLLGGLAWWGYGVWNAHRGAAATHSRLEAAVARIAGMPGTVITDWRIDRDKLWLRGLHDPLTERPSAALTAAGLDPTMYSAEFRPFESSQPAAALARAHQRLAPPETVALALGADGRLQASGVADAAWIERAELLAVTIPGVTGLDTTRLDSHQAQLERRVLAWLAAPDSVRIQIDGDVLALDGVAPLDWIDGLAGRTPLPEGISAMRVDALQALEAVRLNAVREQIEQTWIAFSDGIAVQATQQARVEALAGALAELRDYAIRLKRPVQVRIIGHTDGIGTPEQNLFVARERAAAVAQALRGTGVDLPPLVLGVFNQPPLPRGAEPDLALRRVEFQVLVMAARGRSTNR